MDLVLDTNIIISAIIFGGKPRIILDLIIDQEVGGSISEEIILEVRETLGHKFDYPKDDIDAVETLLRTNFVVVRLKSLPLIVRDAKDNHILAVTLETKIDTILSGDKDLLTLLQYNGIPIMNSTTFLTRYYSTSAET